MKGESDGEVRRVPTPHHTSHKVITQSCSFSGCNWQRSVYIWYTHVVLGCLLEYTVLFYTRCVWYQYKRFVSKYCNMYQNVVITRPVHSSYLSPVTHCALYSLINKATTASETFHIWRHFRGLLMWVSIRSWNWTGKICVVFCVDLTLDMLIYPSLSLLLCKNYWISSGSTVVARHLDWTFLSYKCYVWAIRKLQPSSCVEVLGGASGWGTALPAGRARVRFPIYLILLATLWPWDRLSL